MPDALDLTGLDALLERLDPGRDALAAGLRPPAREQDLIGLPPDLQALWRWHDGQDRAASMARAPDASEDTALLLVQRSGITRRLRPQGRLLSVAESKALRRPGFTPIFEHPGGFGGEPAWVGRRDDGLLVYSFGPRAESGRGGLASWHRSLVEAHRAVYMIGLDHFERPQRWVLAMTAMIGQRWIAASDTFGMVLAPERGGEILATLHDEWDIHSRETARERIAALRLEGMPAAWVWTRVSAIAGWCLRAGYLTLEEAWGHAVEAARELQARYRSWHELGQAEAAVDPRSAAVFTDLVTSPSSPWNLLAWDTPLPSALPPPDEPEVPDVHVVSSSEELARVLFEAAPRSIVRLRSGRYRGSFSPRNAGLVIEAEPDGEVVLEGVEGAAVLHVTGGGTRISGLVVLPADEGVRVESSHLAVDGCAFEGGRGDHIVVPARAHDAATCVVQVERASSVEAGGSAISSLAGLVIASDLIVDGPGVDGLHVECLAELVARETRITRPRRHGITARRSRGVTLSRVEIGRPSHDGVHLDGGAHALERVSCDGAGRSALAIDGKAEVVATSCVWSGSEVANVDLAIVGEVVLAHCRLDGGRRFGAWLHPGHGARFIGTTIGGSRLAAIHVDGGREIVITDADLGPSREGPGVAIDHGGHVMLLDTVVRGPFTAAIEASSSRVEMRGVTVSGGDIGVSAGGGARVAARDLTCRKVGGVAVSLDGHAHAAIEVLVIDDAGAIGGSIINARDEAIALIGNLVANVVRETDRERVMIQLDDHARLAIARGLVSADVVRVGADATLALPNDDPPGPETRRFASAPADRDRFELALEAAAFDGWGVDASVELLARLVARIADQVDAPAITTTVDPRAGRVDVKGPPSVVRRLEVDVRRALATPAAVGLALSALVFEDPEDDGDEAVVDSAP